MEAETFSSILSQIKGLQLQLAALRMEVEKLAERKGSHTFADLKGMLAGQGSSSEAEIDAGLYQITPEFEEDIATLPKESER